MRRPIPFTSFRRHAYILSGTVLLVLLAGTLINGGLNYGIDFVGGTSVIVKFDREVDAGFLAEIREMLSPSGLGNNIRTIGGGGEEAREISVDVRGGGYVDELVDKFIAEREARGGFESPSDLGEIFSGVIADEAVPDLINYFSIPVDNPEGIPLYDMNSANRSDLTDIFQSIFNENISYTVSEAISSGIPPEPAGRSQDINLAGGTDDLAEAFASIVSLDIASSIQEAIGEDTGNRPWEDLDEFFAATGLEEYDTPTVRAYLSEETGTPEAGIASIRFSSPDEIARSFVPYLVRRFRAVSGELVSRRDNDYGGIFPDIAVAEGIASEVDPAAAAIIASNFSAARFIIAGSETVGPSVGADLRKAAMEAVFLSLIGLILYIWWRFELRFGVGAVLALAHDALIVIGFFGLTGREFTIPIVAAVLTVIGYSINDTIVVYDRIRERMGTMRRLPMPEVLDSSITETISRTVATSVTTLAAVLAFYFFGPAIIRDLSTALLVGIITGTYSSIFVAAPLLLEWNVVKSKLRPAAKAPARKQMSGKKR